MRNKYFLRIVYTLFGCTILYFLMIFLIRHDFFIDFPQFDSEKWKTDVSSRSEMVGSLIQSKILLDKSKSEVEFLLGKPDDYLLGSNMPRIYENVDEYWQYHFLLQKPSFYCTVFLVGFHEEGRVVHVHILDTD